MRKIVFISIVAIIFASSCKGGKNKSASSSTTGWNYNDKEWGGFQR
jgi:hypothetical protein